MNEKINIALIPARAGSKGIKNKNIKKLNGKPLIAYTIEAALKSELVSNVYVSTDSSEIKTIALDYGAIVPFLRPTELAQDDTADMPVISHFLNWYKKNNNEIDALLYLRPTTPFKSVNTINEAIKKFYKTNATNLKSVTKVDGVYHPYWMYKENIDKLEPIIQGVDLKKYYRRQLLPSAYRLNGVIDIFSVDFIEGNGKKNKLVGYLTALKESIDIDNDDDFEYAQYLMSRF